MLRRSTALLVVLATVAALGQAGPAQQAQASLPSATTFNGQPTVGAVFLHGFTRPHTCTAAVIRSTRGNLIITAAHCFSGSGVGIIFAPGYRNGVAPYGTWTVTRSYVDPRWKSSRDPRFDYAILQVASASGRSVMSLAGGYPLGLSQPSGTSVWVPAYPAGTGGLPITCTRPQTYTSGYPTLLCNGYPGGVSGSPFLVRVGSVIYVTGVLGGLHNGGCNVYTSYASPITTAINAVYARANGNHAADVLPTPPADGC